MKSENKSITVYTDGSCNPAKGIGAWAAIVFLDGEKVILSGSERNTTHQCMELTAAIKTFEYILTTRGMRQEIILYTDSQYLINLPRRKDKLEASGFVAKTRQPIRNRDLIRELFRQLSAVGVRMIKVKAHETISGAENYNREVDKLSRKIVRDYVRNTGH